MADHDPPYKLLFSRPVVALFRLEPGRDPADVRRVRRDFTVWFARAFLPGRAPGQALPEFHDLQEVDSMLSETVVECTKEWKEDGRLEGVARGLRRDR